MVAPGLPTPKVEIEFTAGVWTDVTADVQPGGVQINNGRSTEFDTVQPGSASFTLDNNLTGTASPYTPDNPLGPYWPNVVENKRTRVTVTKSATNYSRFLGWISGITPVFDGDSNIGTVTFTAVDILGLYATKTLKSDFAEIVLVDNGTLGADLFLFTDPDGSTSVTNFGNRPGGTRGQVIVPNTTGVSFAYGTDTAINLDGTFTPTCVLAGPSYTGPVMEFDYWGGALAIEFWIKTTAAVACTFLDEPSLGDMVGMTAGGVLEFYSGTVNTGVTVNDGLWHRVRLVKNAGNWDGCLDGTNYGHGIGIIYWSGPLKIHLGGSYNTSMTKPSLCAPNTSYAALAIEYDSSIDHGVYGLPNQLVGAKDRFIELCSYHPLTAGVAELGTDNRPVIRNPIVGSDILSAVTELVTTIQGSVYADPANSGYATLVLSDASRPTALTATVTVESDDDTVSAALTLRRGVDIIPTRVTVTAPARTANVTNTAAEAAGRPPKSSSVTSVSATLDDATNLANALLYVSTDLRITQIAVDLSTAQTDLYSALLTAGLIGTRIRVTGLPTAVFGYSYRDVYVQGVAEEISSTSMRLVFDTSPADSPPEGVYDSATYGRYAMDDASTVTGGTCVGNTATGTVILTTATPLTTTGGEYPLDLDWNSERITISGVGGGTSPQTATVTARGVAPSVARVHAAGEAVDVYHSARYAL